jgi:hypothetical protein
MEELLKVVFSMRSYPKLYNEAQRDKRVSCRHELFAAACQPPSNKDGEYVSGRNSINEIRYQATTDEDIEDFMCAKVQWSVECVDT